MAYDTRPPFWFIIVWFCPVRLFLFHALPFGQLLTFFQFEGCQNLIINSCLLTGLGTGKSYITRQSFSIFVSFSNYYGRLLTMEAFGIIGFVFGLAALAKVLLIEKKLKENGVLKQDDGEG